METSLIFLWGVGALVAIIILGIIFSKRNASKREHIGSVVDIPDKEYSQYNEDEYEKDILIEEDEEDDDDWADEPSKKTMCVRCGRVESTHVYDKKSVCEDCYEELDENGEYYDFDEGDVYSGSGISLMSMLTGLMVLGITLTIGITILGSITDAIDSGAINTTEMNAINATTSAIESFGLLGDWFPTILIISVAAIILGIVLQAFGGMRDYGL